MKNGKIKLLQILHRHGDRSPLFNAFEGSTMEEILKENNLWLKKQVTMSEKEKIKQYFNLNDVENISEDKIFGKLTSIGAQEMYKKGINLRNYVLKNHFFKEKDIFKSNFVELFSTGYERTQLSIAFMIYGFLHLKENPEYYFKNPLNICILPKDQDILNMYEVYPKEIDLLKNEMENKFKTLADREIKMKHIKLNLIENIPFFNEKNFTWIKAADYFTCRLAHNIPFISGTEHLLHNTISHASFRFQTFYSHPEIIALLSGKMLKKMKEEMLHVVYQENNQENKKLIVYSAHDISVLAFLFGISADVQIGFWPSYASLATIELIEVTTKLKKKYMVHIKFNGRPVKCKKSNNEIYESLDDFIQRIDSILKTLQNLKQN